MMPRPAHGHAVKTGCLRPDPLRRLVNTKLKGKKSRAPNSKPNTPANISEVFANMVTSAYHLSNSLEVQPLEIMVAASFPTQNGAPVLLCLSSRDAMSELLMGQSKAFEERIENAVARDADPAAAVKARLHELGIDDSDDVPKTPEAMRLCLFKLYSGCTSKSRYKFKDEAEELDFKRVVEWPETLPWDKDHRWQKARADREYAEAVLKRVRAKVEEEVAAKAEEAGALAKAVCVPEEDKFGQLENTLKEVRKSVANLEAANAEKKQAEPIGHFPYGAVDEAARGTQTLTHDNLRGCYLVTLATYIPDHVKDPRHDLGDQDTTALQLKLTTLRNKNFVECWEECRKDADDDGDSFKMPPEFMDWWNDNGRVAYTAAEKRVPITRLAIGMPIPQVIPQVIPKVIPKDIPGPSSRCSGPKGVKRRGKYSQCGACDGCVAGMECLMAAKCGTCMSCTEPARKKPCLFRFKVPKVPNLRM